MTVAPDSVHTANIEVIRLKILTETLTEKLAIYNDRRGGSTRSTNPSDQFSDQSSRSHYLIRSDLAKNLSFTTRIWRIPKRNGLVQKGLNFSFEFQFLVRSVIAGVIRTSVIRNLEIVQQRTKAIRSVQLVEVNPSIDRSIDIFYWTLSLRHRLPVH